MRKFLNKKTESISAAALILGAASLLSRVIGLIRNRVLTHEFGAGEVLDMYYTAFSIPDLLYNLSMLGSLSAGFIPVFIGLYHKKPKKAWQLTNTVLNTLMTLLIPVCILLYFAMPWLIQELFVGFSASQQEQVVMLSRIMLLSPFFLGISNVFSASLQSIKCVTAYAIAPLFYNIGIIIGAVFLAPIYGTEGLAYGVVLGAFTHLAVQIPSMYTHGFRYRWRCNWKDKDLHKMILLTIPRTIAIGSQQLTYLVLKAMASTLAIGSIAVFNLADELQYAAVAIIGVSIAMAAFPALSELSAKDKKEKLLETILNNTRQILLIMLPVMVLLILLRAQIVRVLYGSGGFDWNDTIATANTLGFFAISVVPQALIPLLNRSFYALHNSWLPLFISFIGAIITVSTAYLLKEHMGIAGFGLAVSISMFAQCALLWYCLRRKLGAFHLIRLVPLFSKVSIAVLLMGLGMQSTKYMLGISPFIDMNRFWGIAFQGALSAAVGMSIYLLLLYMLKVKEMNELIEYIEKKTKKIFK